MKYVKVDTILPDSLIREIQKYVQGEYIYIPSQPDARKRWGENSGNRDFIKNRNEDICNKYVDGNSIKELAEEFYLSVDSIKKIVYTRNK